MSDYETERNKRIAANRDMLAMLGLDAAKDDLKEQCRSEKPAAKPRSLQPMHAPMRGVSACRAQKTAQELVPSRRSDRAANLPKVDYKQESLEGEVSVNAQWHHFTKPCCLHRCSLWSRASSGREVGCSTSRTPVPLDVHVSYPSEVNLHLD